MAVKNFWTPQIESQLSAWHSMQKIADQGNPAPCFTISREFGCQAQPMAQALSKRLNAHVVGEPWVVLDRVLLEEVARMSGFSIDQIERSQDMPSSLKAFFSMFLDHSLAEETEIFTHLRKVIRGFAKRGNCILIGRGGVLATQDLVNCIHLRLVAPLEFRIENIMKTLHLGRAEAQRHIALHQQQRDDFTQRFFKGELAEPSHYHLVMNNAHLSVDQMAELAEQYMVRYRS